MGSRQIPRQITLDKYLKASRERNKQTGAQEVLGGGLARRF